MRAEESGKTMRAMRRWLIAVLLLTAFSVNAQTGPPQSLLNRRAPEFVRRDLKGDSIDLAKLRGKVVLLNFWATWCAPCQAEMPMFARWQTQYGPRGLVVVGISMDDDAAPARKLVQKLQINYSVAMGDAALGRHYGGVLGLPSTYLIDRKGVVRAQFQGETDLKKIEAKLQDLLGSR